MANYFARMGSKLPTTIIGVFLLVLVDGLLPREYPIYTFRKILLSFTGKTGSPAGLKRAARFQKVQALVAEEKPFPCDTTNARSYGVPTSVHQLRPGDIDVIGAMGDSLTAANGNAAINILHVATENRGLSWSIGGQGTWREHLTLGNILKEFNPELIGYSYNDSFSHQKAAQFNVAEPGSMSHDMPYMVKVLVKRIRLDPRVDVNNHWKLITLMIGGNDYCTRFCYDYRTAEQLKRSPEDHRRNLIKVLDYLRDNLPRTLVNLVISPHVGYLLKTLVNKPPACRITHMMECPCLFGLARENPSYLRRMYDAIEAWRRVEVELADDPKYNSRDDFAVVLQPFLQDLRIPIRNGRSDYSLISEDCFHLSQKGAARAANSLWNNMMEPVGQKSTNWEPTFSRFLCPSPEHPYISTNYNSLPTDIDVKQT